MKNAKPREAKYTLAGGHGLTLLVMPDGSKYWRLWYRFGGKRRREKLALAERVANTFGKAADSWHVFRSKAWDAKTAEQARHYLDKDVLPKVRSRPLDSVTATELGALIVFEDGVAGDCASVSVTQSTAPARGQDIEYSGIWASRSMARSTRDASYRPGQSPHDAPGNDRGCQ